MANVMKLNGKTCEFKNGETILQIARRNNIDIPTLCYLSGASPTGACRICIVEVKGAPGPVASCSTPAVTDMEILTETPRIVEARKTVIELLLISGNHNCAIRGNFPQEWTDFQNEVETYDQAENICVAYGECSLQALAYKYMVSERSVDRIPSEYPLEYDDPLIGRDFSRCILCGRCIQACNEIQVNNALSHGYRGNISKIVVKGDKTLPQSDCVYCGECLQSCPVGSLFEKRNRFKARMWETKQVTTTCYYCGVGCQMNLHINQKENKIVKVEGSGGSEVNQNRLCFKGRFGFDFIHSDKRLTQPMIRKNGKLTKATWQEAIDLISLKLNEVTDDKGPDAISCIISTKYSNEDLFQAKKFFNTVVACDNITHFDSPGYLTIDYSAIRKASSIILIGADLTKDNPVAASYVKQAVLDGKQLSVLFLQDTEIARFAHKHLKRLTEVEKEIEEGTVIIHDPSINISSVGNLDKAKIVSFSKENNTMGAYLIDIVPRDNFNSSQYKFLYSFGSHSIKDTGFEFLVVQDIFMTELAEKADVLLPAAAWVEYEGTTISSGLRLNKTKKVFDAPGGGIQKAARRYGKKKLFYWIPIL